MDSSKSASADGLSISSEKNNQTGSNAEDCESTTAAIDYEKEIQRLALESQSWAKWELPDDYNFEVPADLVDRIDFKKPVSLPDLKKEMLMWEAEIAQLKAESEQSPPEALDVMSLDELSEKMQRLVADLTAGRDRLKQQTDYLRHLDAVTQCVDTLHVADETADRVSHLVKSLQLSADMMKECDI